MTLPLSRLRGTTRRPFTFLLFLLGAWGAIAAPTKVLTVGNSFADNATRFLEQIADSQGVEMQIVRANLGGSDLERHARHLAQSTENPEDPAGRPYRVPGGENEERRGLIEALKSERWDVVTIQQVSRRSFDPASYEPFAATLIDAIRTDAPQAEILVHQTWAYREDHPWFQGEAATTAAGNATSNPRSQLEMYRRLTSAYDALAARYHLRVLPVGDAFQLARSLPPWRFQFPDTGFDYEHPEEGSVPPQDGSLNVGWIWAKNGQTGERSFRQDANHANDAGCYLGACVWFERITGQTLSGDVWKPATLTDEQAVSLRRIAHDVVVARSLQPGRAAILPDGPLRDETPPALYAPYPASDVIAEMKLDWSTHRRAAEGSDNFQLAWSADDHLYGSWGDGGGFGGSNRLGRVSLGVGRVEGPAEDYQGYNIWGGHEAAAPATFNGKSWGMIAIGTKLYSWVVPDVPPGEKLRNHYAESVIYESLDNGLSWNRPDWQFTSFDELTVPTFLNFGRGGTGVPDPEDGYVYTYFVRPETPGIVENGPEGRGLIAHRPGQLFLARTRPDQLMASRDAYEFFVGLDETGDPQWGSIAEKVPVFDDPNGAGWCVSSSYHPGLNRYLLVTQHAVSEQSNLGVFDAPKPWGPWTTVAYHTPLDPFGALRPGSALSWKRNVFFAAFPTKWFEDDTFTLTFTGAGRGGDNDSFNTVRGRFVRP